MSSMYVSETDCLAKLAGYMGSTRKAVATKLQNDAGTVQYVTVKV